MNTPLFVVPRGIVILLAFLAAIALFQFGYADKRVHYR